MPDAEVLIGERTPRGCDGCLDSHKRAVRLAQQKAWPCVFVMEDDCAFVPAFSLAQWEADAAWAQAHGYDVLAGGCTRTYGAKRVRSGLLEVSAFHSAHCLVYFASGYDKVLRAVQPFDLSLGCETVTTFATTYVGCRIVLTAPFVAVQRPSFSGILQRHVNYVPDYVAHEKVLEALA